MKQRNIFGLLLLIATLVSACQPTDPDTSLLSPQDRQRIVLLGGSLVAGMEDYGFFERSVLTRYAGESVRLRNIGWPADDVYGLARSQFGSAQNTRSWQPPSAEAGFGSKVLWEQIAATDPTTLIIGYGSEVAFAESEEDFALFTSGYTRLLDYADSLGAKLVLLSPPRQEVFGGHDNQPRRNEWLGRAAAFIRDQAAAGAHVYIDLHDQLVTTPDRKQYTENGVGLNELGYQRLSELLLTGLGIPTQNDFALQIDENGRILGRRHCQTSDWTPTVHGAGFQLSTDRLRFAGEIVSPNPVAVVVNGVLQPKSPDTLARITLPQDSLLHDRLLATIREKNRLYRYRLQPLNEAYIYLFRRHEMGHLAYEMDELEQLVAEKEQEIERLLARRPTYDIEIELIRPWQPPKDYPEDEVPAFVPEPDIEKELAAFHPAPGYEVSLFAADPMIANPISINWDSRGRAWVATSSTYPHIVPGREPNDRIVILEDTDGDGRADKHTVFAENLLIPHSVMPVAGGAYVTASTELLFLADTDGDDVADSRRVVFDGFGNADVHHMIHGLRWAPWGDLYFTQSIYINSFVETAYGPRVLNGSGIWSFRPETEALDIFSRGLINPWGHAFDEWGQAFATDGAGSSGINYVFPGSAHATAVGAARVLPGLNSGTPKNTAAEVVYSRHFPPEWQGSIVTNDFRANRTVRYRVQPHESGYAAAEIETLLRSDHRSYRPVDTKIGPDGALYIVDWYNPIIDHGEVDFHHPIRDKTHGRVWRLTKTGSPLVTPPRLAEAPTPQLLEQLRAPEQATRLRANRALVERACEPRRVLAWIAGLSPTAADFERSRLEGLWLLTALGHYDEPLLATLLRSAHPPVRAAAVRMLAHWNRQEAFAEELARSIQNEHPRVRLEALHALREWDDERAIALAIHALDSPLDENLDYALWLTLSSREAAWLPGFDAATFGGDAHKQLYALLAGDNPAVVPHLEKLVDRPGLEPDLIDRAWLQLAELGGGDTRARVLRKADREDRADLLRAMVAGPADAAAIPADLGVLPALFTHDSLAMRVAALQLAGRWRVHGLAPRIAERLAPGSAPQVQLAAARALVALGRLEEVETLARTAEDLSVRTAAGAVWIENEPERAAPAAVALLNELDSPERAELLFRTFQSQEAGPAVLQKALRGKTIPEAVASVGLRVAQTSGLNLTELDAALRQAGGLQPIGNEMSREDKNRLVQAALASGSVGRGREIYRRPELLCATCHRIDGIGGLSGPELTTVGSYMTPNSLLESILSPSSDIKQGYETVLITLTDGEILSGLLHRKTASATLLRLPDGEIVSIPSREIAKIDVSPVSLMPAGLTRGLHEDELRDLLAYLIALGREG